MAVGGRPRLELQDVVVRRGGRETLRVERLAVHAGEVLAVIGPNGAGKSTLLQVAGFLLRPSEGEIRFDGAVVGAATLSYRRRTAVAMQEAILLHESVLENAALGLKLRGVGRREREALARVWLRRFDVEALSARPAWRLSGGEAQRVSLARAFALRPDLLLLDEPFGGLDEPTREAILDDLASVLAETGVATVFVTHDRQEAMRLADSIAVVLGGRLCQWGRTEDVFAAPADEEVAAFVGVENILPARVVAVGDGLARVEVGGREVVALASTTLPPIVRLCLRPEDIVLQVPGSEGPSGSARNLLAGTVREVRLLGPQARVLLDCGFPLVAVVTRLSAEDLGLVAGRRVVAHFKATAIHLLPAQHGD